MAMAWLFGRLGARVAICGRSAERLEQAAADMTAHGIDIFCIPTDIRDEEAVARLFDAVTGRFGSLDDLVNHPGGQYPQEAGDLVPQGWRARKRAVWGKDGSGCDDLGGRGTINKKNTK